ncbi:MAG TPA: hypothetical protein VNA25_09550, partial [Phycisphaerae bacterium]|nr:hypothetical protein [Phycisphaerae bacterium]
MPSRDSGCQALTGFLVPVGMLPAAVLVTFPAARLAGVVGGCWGNAYLAGFSRWVGAAEHCRPVVLYG